MVEEKRQIIREIGKSIRGIFFDLDETLVDDDRCMRVAVAQTCTKLARRYLRIDPGQLEATYLRVADEWWTGSGSVPRASSSATSDGKAIRVEVWSKALAACDLPTQHLAIEAADLYSQERRASYCLFPDVDEVLHLLCQTFVLGVITNGAGDTQREKLRVTGIADYMDVFIVSGDVGVGKPEPGIFIKALESAQVMPREAIYVGDSLTWDIAGAKSAGMHGVWMNRKRVSKPRDATQPDIEITSLRDLIPMLGSDK